MTFNDDQLHAEKNTIRNCLRQLYNNDRFLFERNNGRGICERGLVFRFAHYLQYSYTEHYVDCDFNSSFSYILDEEGNVIESREREGKPIDNGGDGSTKRFVDIIIHNRDYQTRNDHICFEIKKWNNKKPDEVRKDRNNLIRLTSDYGYSFGFHIILGRNLTSTIWSIFNNGQEIETRAYVFEEQEQN